MKPISHFTLRTLLAGAALLAALPGLQAAGEEPSTSEEIDKIVEEAQRVASEWAQRIRDWNSGKQEPSTYIGVVVESVPEVLRDYIDLPKGVGLLLARIVKDGPADKAGLKDNDILVEMDGQIIINYSQLTTLIDMRGPGAVVKVKILRKGAEMTFDVTLEERMRRGTQFMAPEPPVPPEAPQAPEAPAAPEPPEAPDSAAAEQFGAMMERIEEWIPGSVRVYIDKNEQVHVDLQDLKEDLHDLREKLKYVKTMEATIPGIVKEHGDLGARTTVIHISDQNVNYRSKQGQVSLASSETGQQATVWDAEGNVIYQGGLPQDYESTLPPKAVELINALKASRQKLEIDSNTDQLEINLRDQEQDGAT